MAEDEFSWGSSNFEPIQSIDQQPSPSPQTQLKQWSMAPIRDSSVNSDCFVFPPINHENLQISSQFDHEEPDPPSQVPCSPSPSASSSSSSLSSASSFSPSDVNWADAPSHPPALVPPSFNSGIQKSGEVNRWLVFGIGFLYSRAVRLASSFRNCVAVKGSIWSFLRSTGVVAVVMAWLYMRVRRRRRNQGGSANHLTQIIRDKDERILQLLHQIAQMNEVLVARHKVLTSKLAE